MILTNSTSDVYTSAVVEAKKDLCHEKMLSDQVPFITFLIEASRVIKYF